MNAYMIDMILLGIVFIANEMFAFSGSCCCFLHLLDPISQSTTDVRGGYSLWRVDRHLAAGEASAEILARAKFIPS